MNARHVFLTGTGTIGRELLLALLQNPATRVKVLMRDRGRRTAVERAQRLFSELELEPTQASRVEVLSGDITRSGLGLDTASQSMIIDSVDLMIHTAATTSLTADRELCDAVNRHGTANALIFAEKCLNNGKLNRFVHLSTVFIAGGNSRGRLQEDELPIAPAHLNHYEWSKFDAERIARAAMQAGLPVTIFRPSMVAGDTDSGRTRDFNVVYPLMRMLASGYVTRFPASPEARVHLAPINFVVEAIMQALCSDWTINHTFNLTSAEPPSVSDLLGCDAFFPVGAFRPVICAPEEFSLINPNGRERDLLESVAFCLPYLNSRLSIDTGNTARLLSIPRADASYLTRLGQYAVESGYIRRMAA